jgi:menaquinone-specific isochorismate synthase
MLDLQAPINHVSTSLKRILTKYFVRKEEVLSISLTLNKTNLHSLAPVDANWFFWNHPANDETILGLGRAVQITVSGPDRFETLNHKLQQLHSNWKWIDPEQTNHKPLGYLCFAFNHTDQMTGPWSGLPNSGLFLPELTIQQKDNGCVATFSAKLGKNVSIESVHQRWATLFTALMDSLCCKHTPPGCRTTLKKITTSADQGQWQQLISKAQSSISSGTIEKVVPARHLLVQAERNLDPKQLMTALGYLYPNSMLLTSRIGGRVFVSATPECFVNYQKGEIQCDALAGTIQRSATEKIDQDLGQSLLSDPKAKHEHQLVVQDITTSLGTICTNLEFPEQPSLLCLRNLQHLHTEIRGQLKPDISLLQAAAKLHPTAAVNGYPGPEATRWLMQNEGIDRGWYAGVAGWIDYNGDGKLAVLLRCALLDENHADLFAGAGITAESDANAEYAETELKFRVMLEALENA